MKINKDNAFEILEGPEKFDFIIKSFSGKNQNRDKVTFIIRGERGPIKIGGSRKRRTIKIVINSLSWKNQSSDDWFFEGKDSKGKKVEGYYNASIHSGYLDFEDKDNKNTNKQLDTWRNTLGLKKG